MSRLAVPPSKTVYVGDMYIDAQTGRRAGVKTIMVTTGSSTPDELQKERPYAIIPCVKAILSLIA